MDIILIITFILMIVFIALFVVMGVIKKSFFDKKNLVYFIPLFVLSIITYSVGYKYKYGSYDLTSFYECLAAALKAFAFDIKKDYVVSLLKDNALFRFTFYPIFTLCGITTISTFLGFIKVEIANFFRLVIRIFKKDLNIVVGLNEMSVDFASRNKNTIILVDKTKGNFRREERNEFYKKGICFIVSEIKPRLFNTLFKTAKGKIYIFQFSENVEEIKKILDVISSAVIEKDRMVEFNVMSDDSNLQFVNKKLTEARAKSKSNGKIIATAFNIYNLIGKEFTSHYNLAEFLPKDFLEDGLLNDKKNISVAMIGSGKISNSVLEHLILNNQFAIKSGDKYQIKPIKFDLFDNDLKAFDRRIVNLFKKTNNPNLTAIVDTHELNARTNFDMHQKNDSGELIPNPSDDNFVYYFINVGTTLDNERLVNSIMEQTDSKNYVIFYCVDSEEEMIKFNDSENIIPFGFKTKILDRNKISNDIHYEESKHLNELYNKTKGNAAEFTTLNIIEKLSNLFNVISCEFKLNLIGLTRIPNNNKANAELIKKNYFAGHNEAQLPYEEYFKINIRNTLRFIEHARWYTYYYINGFRPMPIKDIKLIDGKICHKKLDLKLHACVVSYYELDKVHRFEAELIAKEKSISFEKALMQTETYQYDSENIDDIIRNHTLYERKN